MAEYTAVDDSTEPTTDLADLQFPEGIADRLGTLYGTPSVPDYTAWVDAIRAAQRDRTDRPPTADDLCTTPNGAHRFVSDNWSQQYVCVLDPLVVPYLRDKTGTVRSTTPVRGETIEIRIDGEGASVSHPDAVVSLGVSDHVDGTTEPTLETIYRQVCGYIHIFADAGEYETWAADADAATMRVPVETGVGIAKGLAAALFADTD